MPSIISGFEYDIFISYRHKDNRNGGVTEFVEYLRKELEATFKEDVSIYFDSNASDGLLENHHVDKSLEGKLKCLIFIPIISQTYCDPKSFAWQHEFCAFNKLSKEDQFGRDVRLSNGNVASRILPIRVHDLDAEDRALIENEIGGVLRAIEFMYKEPGVNRPLSVSDKKSDNQNNTDYKNQVNKVANAIKEIIHAMKNPAAQTASPGLRPPASAARTSSSRGKNIVIGLLACLVLAAGGFFTYEKLARNDQRTDNNASPEKSIAVLPFTDMSASKDQEYFSDGLSEELLNLLAKIPELKVIARTSSFSFKGKNEDLRVIGEKLGVAHILEGSVRKSGNILRITAQLIKVADGSHLWSNTYDRSLDDIFKVQDEISAAVVAQLKLTLLKTAAPVEMKPEAYNLYLQGKFILTRVTKESAQQALEKFRQALAIDPGAAAPWAKISKVYHLQANVGSIPVDEAYKLARAAAEKAIQLDPTLADAYTSLGSGSMNYEWDFAKADAYFKKALLLDPEDAAVIASNASIALNMGRLDEAIALFHKSINADPLRVAGYVNISLAYYGKGDLKAAEAAIRKAIELAPSRPSIYFRLSKIQLAQGDYAVALQSIQQEIDEGWKADGLPMVYFKLNQKTASDAALKNLITTRSDTDAVQIADVYAFRGETDKAFEWLERAYLQRDGGLAEIVGDPELRSLRSDARWHPFLKKMRLE